MKENVGIVILLLITTLIYSVILVKLYDSSRTPEDVAAVEEASEDSVSADYPALEPYEEDIPIPVQAFYFSAGPVNTQERLPVSSDGIQTGSLWSIDKIEKPKPGEDAPAPSPVDLVIDLDYNSDVDDAAALRIAAMLDRMGRISLKAAMASTGGEKVCKALHSQLSYDGYGAVPIGMAAKNIAGGSPYWDDMINHYFTPGDYRVYNSVELYKQVLREKDRLEKEKEKERKRYKELFELKDEEMPEELMAVDKIRIVTTGYLVNIEALLKDPEGFALVCNYVDSLWVTGGVYLQGEDHNFVCTRECADAARYVLSSCPVTLIFSSSASIRNDDGSSIFCGGSILATDRKGTDPVTMAYKDYGKANNVAMFGGRDAWDPFCLWAASLPQEETNTRLESVNLAISKEGYNYFSYVLPPNTQIIRRNSNDLGWYSTQLELLINAGLR